MKARGLILYMQVVGVRSTPWDPMGTRRLECVCFAVCVAVYTHGRLWARTGCRVCVL